MGYASSMKALFLLSLVTFSVIAEAKPQRLLCTQKLARIVVPIAEAHSSYDKNRHCTVSCMLALSCNDGEVLLAGILKEFKDVFGAGNAELADLIADRHGISLVRTDRARTNQECLEQCDLRYRADL